jgi:4'-phosphopantetheinyl transferase
MLDHVNPEHHLRSMIGYHLAWENSLVGMVMVQGKQREVVNIGLGIKQVAVEPRDVTVPQYVESLSHKVCVWHTFFFWLSFFCLFVFNHHEASALFPLPLLRATGAPLTCHPKPQLTSLELSFLNLDLGEEVVLRRLCILLALKSAYIKAIGQPIGFDWSRLEFNISEETCSGDGQPLTGWEFRLYKAHLGVQRRGVLIEESYQCVTAHFRGTADSKFVWQDNNKDLESWVQFINIDQMTNVIPKLTD